MAFARHARGPRRQAPGWCARHLFFANQGIFRVGDRDEIMNKVTALSVLSNAVLVWNSDSPRSWRVWKRRPAKLSPPPPTSPASRPREHACHPERNLLIPKAARSLELVEGWDP